MQPVSFHFNHVSVRLSAMSRWGDCRSPAYGTLSDYPFMRPHTRNEKRLEKARAAWGEALTGLNDVIKVFVKYTKGKLEATAVGGIDDARCI